MATVPRSFVPDNLPFLIVWNMLKAETVCCQTKLDFLKMDNEKLHGGFPDWRMLKDIGAGEGPTTKCERCPKPGTPRQQLEHVNGVICYIYAGESVN